ncbi:putative uncharacterized protein [Mycolicibacterium fortuitum subsp. acetamidolyticum]|uniref:Uncharacterized protein n=1 Tax=Mycolicibacterium fortuitum subsp. acetamidolyticum TaxID=144550 RepID=A0A100WPF0_MYCFO|nr:putative uncharacterized protein [Mycolicibacterium fortuitum subsp. acetamidolyticum]
MRALNDDMRARGATWPDQIVHPGPFLAHRLRYLPARPEAGATEPKPIPGSPTDEAISGPLPHQHEPQRPSAPTAARLAAQRSIRETLARLRRQSSSS